MPLYMCQWRYKDPEINALISTGEKRDETVRMAVEAFGGQLLGFYFCQGRYHGMSVVDFPDIETMQGCILSTIGAGGLECMDTTALLTPEQISRALTVAREVVSPYRVPSVPIGSGEEERNAQTEAGPLGRHASE